MEVLSITNSIQHNSNPEDYLEYNEVPEQLAMVKALSKRLEAELRSAKRTHFSVGEVLLPYGLTRNISQDVFEMADSELCGLRGCTLHINFEGYEVKRKLSTIKCDPTTPSTFEVYLTLFESTAGWNAFLPQFLKKMTRGGTVMISPSYNIEKKQLYRSSMD